MSTYKYLDENGLTYYHSKVKALLNGKVDVVSGKGLSTNDYTTTEKNKLSGIASGAEVNQNAFSNVVAGETTVQADSKTDTLTLSAGSNVQISGNATTDTITISATDTTYESKSASSSGTELSLVTTGEKYTWNNKSDLQLGTTATTASKGNHTHTTTIATDTGTNALTMSASTKYKLTAGGTTFIFTTPSDTTYSNATTSTAGLMSSEDKTKLNGIATGATANTGTITGVSVNGTSVATSGVANITSVPASILSGAIPSSVTATTQTAGNNSTKIATTAFVATAITNAISGITGISFEIVTTLPSTGNAGTIYLVSHGGTGTNIYDEYIYVNNAWEKIGTTDVDLSGYVQTSDMVTITNAEIDTIVA